MPTLRGTDGGDAAGRIRSLVARGRGGRERAETGTDALAIGTAEALQRAWRWTGETISSVSQPASAVARRAASAE